MSAHIIKQKDRSMDFATPEQRWQAVVNRDPAADGQFFYSVKTTGVYCRTVCPARLALRTNVEFHDTCQAAEKAGFRACKRCRPSTLSLSERHSQIVANACRLIEDSKEPFTLEELATATGISQFHLHRLFRAHTGLTPHAYATAQRARRAQKGLCTSNTITDAIYESGFTSSSRFYDSANATLGMTPTMFRTGGKGAVVRFALGESYLGAILVAASHQGICAISLGDSPEALLRDLQDRFPNAQFVGQDRAFESLVAKVIALVSNPSIGLDLPLDIQGSAFQIRVWDALRQIPVGSLASYRQIAEQIGQPLAARAVAKACGSNPLAVAIPCHRVVRVDGSLSGYRWGIERKNQLLRREHEAG